jgi:uncharacterized protein YjbJ (UPF0337 family)
MDLETSTSRTEGCANAIPFPGAIKEDDMNRQQLEGNWKQVKGRAKAKWGKLTDDDLDQIQGRQQILVGKLQERYGKALEAAEKEVNEWIDALDTKRN